MEFMELSLHGNTAEYARVESRVEGANERCPTHFPKIRTTFERKGTLKMGI